MSQYHLAQMNIATGLGDLDEPIMAGFVSQLDYINTLAERSPGFVWRLKDESGNATEMSPYADPRIIVNMSIWESIEDLHNYTYKSDHFEVLRDRKKWFSKHRGFYSVLWWVPIGYVPTVEEGKERLDHLIEHGPTSFAFTFSKPSPQPNLKSEPVEALEGCGS